MGIRVAFSCPIADRNPVVYGDPTPLANYGYPTDSPHGSATTRSGGEDIDNAVGDLVHLPQAVNADCYASIVIDVEQGPGLRHVHLESLANGLGAVVGTAPGEHSLDELGLIDLEHDNLVESVLADQIVERPDLSYGSRKAVEDVATGRLGLADSLFEHRDGDLIWHVIPSRHDGFDLHAEFTAVGDMVAKHFSGGHMRNAQSLGDTLRLGSLAGTGWAYE